MAFDAFRTQAQTARVSPRRRLIYAASVLFHAALITVGVAYSFWHIEELTPPLLKVTFLSAAPPPPPPPPPAGGGGAARKPKVQVKPKTVVQPKPTEIVQPREEKKEPPKEEPKPDDGEKGEKGGVKGGVEGGTVGGTVGGTIGGKVGGVLGGTPGGTGVTAAPKFLPPHIGVGQRISGSEKDVPFPPSLRKPGVIYRVLAKITVNASGMVEKVTIMKGADPLLDEGVVNVVKTWRFRPYLANNMPIPFSFTNMFEFRSE
jgi:protein TonB